ncbi:MAG: hypothetical protein Q4B01_01965 [Eubacteriales bacterium]|nr:hypothetical protein [Eubacteriales bacterium]
MMKKGMIMFMLSACVLLSATGCRRKLAKTETETETKASEVVTEVQNAVSVKLETETEKQSETEKKSTSGSTTTGSTPKTTAETETKATVVKPSTVTTEQQVTEAANYGTDQCPYCGNYFSLAPNDDGTTVYSSHVAQEAAWAAYMSENAQDNSGSTAQDNTAQSETSAATSQCPYCYGWYTVADGSYDAHVATHYSASLGSDYVVCPLCGNTYASGVEYDTHYCTGAQ